VLSDLEKALSNNFKKFTPVLEFLDASKYIPIDLSSASKLIKDVDISNPLKMDLFIKNYLEKNNKTVAFGGYLEKRNLYDRSDYFNGDIKRNIHLGVDLWCPVKTNVLAPLNGKINSFGDNLNFGDYGPTIILEHKLDNKFFYTLYGHLSKESIADLEIGKKINKGEIIAQLGNHEENGNYAPHLHFQIIDNIGSFFGDYPGVSDESNLGFYKENCPDPNLILGLE
jgi:murein DD-endopeptidase MepM/ murein hydrolase activator NlpD